MSGQLEHMSSEELIQFRMNNNLNTKQLASLIGVTFQAVQLWERGERSIPTTVTRIIRLFKKFPQLKSEFGQE